MSQNNINFIYAEFGIGSGCFLLAPDFKSLRIEPLPRYWDPCIIDELLHFNPQMLINNIEKLQEFITCKLFTLSNNVYHYDIGQVG